MGFLDKMKKAVEGVLDADISEVAKKIEDSFNNSGNQSQSSQNYGNSDYSNQNYDNQVYDSSQSEYDDDGRSFDEKFKEICGELGIEDVKTNVPVNTLETEFARDIYTKSGVKPPKDLSYVLYKDGSRTLIVRYFVSYPEYNRRANRDVKEFCQANGVKIVDFFGHLPNQYDYMKNRINSYL